MPSISNHLNILSWNARGIHSITKRAELQILLAEQNIDVFCLQETFLDHTFKLYIDKFVIYRKDRTNHGGGVAIGVKCGIDHSFLGSCANASIENVSVRLNINNQELIVTSVYNPQHTSTFVADLLQLFHPEEFLLFGDLNAKHTAWNCLDNNATGVKLLDAVNRSNCVLLHSMDHTHFPANGGTPSTLDIVITNTSTHLQNITSLMNQLSSDHSPVMASFSANIRHHDRASLDLKRANWKRFQAIIRLSLTPTPLDNADQVEAAINVFINTILSASEASVPLKKVTQPLFQLEPDTLAAIKYKNTIVRSWQRCTDLIAKRSLKCSINIARKLIAELVSRDRNARWSKFLHGLGENDKAFWRLTKSLRGKNPRFPDSLFHNDRLLTSSGDKAEALADVFHNNNTSPAASPFGRAVSNYIDQLNISPIVEDSVNHVSLNELQQTIKFLRPFKAPGSDGILNILLKKLPPEALQRLKDIFNSCISLGYWPAAFKKAKVIPIPKAGKDRGDAKNYRPISLLSAVGKTFEKLILSRINDFDDDNSITNKEQFGFRSEHSTTHQLLRVTKHISSNKAAKKSTGLVLLDIEKAFDSVWHDGLIFKLNKYGFPLYLCKLVQAFCANREFYVKLGDSTSSARPIHTGLPQGSSLSPKLYNLFVSDLKYPSSVFAACYADDTAILIAANRTKTVCKRLQLAFISLEKYFTDWKIKINTEKTRAIIFPFNNQRKRQPSAPLTLGANNLIEFSREVKYLGIALDQKLNFGSHIAQTRIRTIRCIAALYPLLCRKSVLTHRNKLMLFKSVIRPTLSYGSTVWAKAARSHHKSLQILQNKCLKIIFKLNWRYPTAQLHDWSGIPLLYDFQVALGQNMLSKCANSRFEHLRELC